MKKILIIDDYEFHAELLARRLSKHIDASRIVLASNGEEGIHAFFDDPEIVLVVSDFNMDGFNGEEVFDRIEPWLKKRNGVFYIYSVDSCSKDQEIFKHRGIRFADKAKEGYEAIAETVAKHLD